MSDAMAIRLATESDAGVIAEFNCAMARETEARELDPAVVLAGTRNLLANPAQGFYVVAEIDGEVAGSLMVTYEWSDWRNALYWWIQSVYVLPAQRGQGIYRQLYQFVKSRARERGGVCGFRLYVHRDNDRAQQSYRALGMTETDYRIFEEMS